MRDGAGSERTPERRGRREVNARVVLAIASIGGAVTFIDATIVNIAFPNIARSFPGSSIAALSWVLNAYNIVFAAFLVAAGRMADLLGRRRVFVFGLELFTVASALCALAPSLEILIACRVIQALGAACIVPSSLALVLNAFPPERRAHGAALLSAVAAGAAGLGPSLGGLLVSAYDWRLVFLVNIPIGVIAAVLARRELLENRAAGRRRVPDLLGALMLAIGMGLLVLALVQAHAWGWGSPRTLGCLVLALALVAVFVRRCAVHREPIIDLSLLRIRSVAAGNAMMIVGAAGFYAYTLTNVLFLTRVWGYSVLAAGLSLTPGPLIALLIAGPSSRLARRFGPRPVLVAGCLLWSAGVFWLAARMDLSRDFLGTWLPGIIVLGIGAGASFPTLSATAVSSAPGDRFATATGLNSVARQLGAAVGVAAVVAILGHATAHNALAAFHDSWHFGAAALLAAGCGSFLIGRVRLDEPEVPVDDSVGSGAYLFANRTGTGSGGRARRGVAATDAPMAGPQSTADFLAAVPIFTTLDRDMLEQLAVRSRRETLDPGAWLFHQGDAAQETFIVRTGRLEVVDEDSGSVIRELGRGDVIGELALLTGSARSAGVRAARASELVAIDRRSFENLLETSPRLSLSLARSLAGQLSDTRAALTAKRPLPVTVALITLDARVPLEEVVAGLREAASRHVAAAVLGPRELPTLNGSESAASVFGPLLDRTEAAAQLVLLQAGTLGQRDPWLEFCLAQADRILVLTSGGPIAIGDHDRASLRGCDLVTYAVTPGAGLISGLADMLEPIESHGIDPATLGPDLARIARRLTGNSLGIVLSGGGARALSHIGVLDELLAAGVVIDRVAGVSMGAMIGGLFAMGLDPAEIDAICFEEWVQRRPLGDYTLPRRALIRGERVQAMLNRQFGARLIEELPRSFVCGYAELRSGELVLARHGALADCIGLSMCLPVIGPPQVRGRNIFIDGSFVDNLPVEPMAALGEGPLIAVDVKASFDESSNHAMRRRAPATSQEPGVRVPNLGETLTRVLLLGSSNTSEAARRHADLIIKPQAGAVGLLEFQQIDAAVQAGRAAARHALQEAPGWLFGHGSANSDHVTPWPQASVTSST